MLQRDSLSLQRELKLQPRHAPALMHAAPEAIANNQVGHGGGFHHLRLCTAVHPEERFHPWASCNTSPPVNLCNVYSCKGVGGLIAHGVV